MFKPGWYISLVHHYYEYFISEDGWSISSTPGTDVFIDKYDNTEKFFRVDNIIKISNLNKNLLQILFSFGWSTGNDDKLELL